MRELGWRYVVGILVTIYCLIPLLYVLSVSLSPGATLAGANKLFQHFSLENFQALGQTTYLSLIHI